LVRAVSSEARDWAEHIGGWNGRCTWRAPTAQPVVFASDASTSGFAYGLEQCPVSLLPHLEPAFQPGAVRAGVWSASNGDAGRQQTSSTIQYGEFFCVVAAAVEFGERLSNQHVVFVVDNNSDVAVINRLRSREPRVAGLLRVLCDLSWQYNFTFAAVHRAGADNVLMDWASRPLLHRFVATPTSSALLSRDQCGVVGLGVGGGAFPPLLHPTSLTYINSRCLTFEPEGNCASWTSSCGGW
jgi:hypothetical protein